MHPQHIRSVYFLTPFAAAASLSLARMDATRPVVRMLMITSREWKEDTW
jgi:hypothetical protein